MADQKYCRNCGGLNPPDAQFCANCGKAFVSASASPSHAAPSAASMPWEQQPRSSSSSEPTIFGFSRKWVVIGVVALFLVFTLGCVTMARTPSSATPTPTAVVTATVKATAKATATPTAKATATPTSTPSSPARLTQAQLNAGEAALVSDGYTFTKHFTYDHTNADGTLVYKAEAVTPEGYTETVQLTVYKDQASADAGLDSSVAILKAMGFSGSYDDAYTWTGTTIYQGQAVGGGAVESSGGAPYMVTVFFMA